MELFEAMVSIPLTIKGDAVRVLEREENQKIRVIHGATVETDESIPESSRGPIPGWKAHNPHTLQCR